MKFASVRLIAADIGALVSFYENITATPAQWLAPVFAEIVTPAATLAIGSVETMALFKPGAAQPAANRTAILEFMVADVDAEFARLRAGIDLVHEPKDMPWGNRTFMFNDPEGSPIAFYTPVTEAARLRFAGR